MEQVEAEMIKTFLAVFVAVKAAVLTLRADTSPG